MITETLLLLILLSIFIIVLSALFIGMVFPVFRGAVFVGSSKKAVRTMVELSNIKKGEKVADLGSGDGRVVIAFAKEGAEAHGFEINPILVWLSRRRIKKEGLQDKAFIHRNSFWGADCSEFDVITIFGIGYIMKKLDKKLFKELEPGARVVSSAFEFPNREADDVKNGTYLYIKK